MAKSPKIKKGATPVFNVGDRVRWTSQAAGTRKTKTGTIVEAPDVGQRFHGQLLRRATTRHRYKVAVVTVHSRGERTDFYYPSTSAMALVTSAS